MNIVFLSDYGFVDGGASAVAQQSAVGLASRGFRVGFFCVVGPVSDDLIASGIDVHCLNGYDLIGNPSRFQAARNGIWNSASRNAIAEYLKKFPVNDSVIHIHTWTKALSSSVINMVLSLGYRVYLTMHDYFLACPNGGFYDFHAQEICTRRAMSIKCVTCNCDARSYPQKVFRLFRQTVQTHLGRAIDSRITYIAVSNFSMTKIRSYLPKNAKIHLLKSPIHIQKQAPVDVARNKKFIFVGRLCPEKGCDIFAQAAAVANVDALFVGDGNLKGLLQRINNRAEITGWVNKSQLPGLLSQARALVFPSRLYETLGLSVIEAFSMGIPVLTSDNIAASEIVTDGRTGWHFPNGDYNALASILNKLAKSDEIVASAGSYAYDEYWLDPWSIERHLDNLISIYKQPPQKIECSCS